MDWDAVGAMGELLGAGAVLASLIYLGVQIRGNSRSTRTATEVEAGKASAEWMRQWADDDELLEVWDRVAGRDALEPYDARRYLWMVCAYCILAQTVLDQYEQEMVSERCWENFERTVVGLVQPDFARIWWAERGGNFSSALYERIDSRLSDDPAWIPPVAGRYVASSDSTGN